MVEKGKGERAPLLTGYAIRVKQYTRSVSVVDDELHNFRSWLRWMCVDQSDLWRTLFSWSLFFTLAVAVPFVSYFIIVVDSDREGRRRHASYDAVIQLSLTSVSAVSFLCLSAFVRLYGLRRFLYLDKLCRESETVRLGYTAQLNGSFKLLLMFVLPCFMAEGSYKIWWYCTGEGRVTFLGNPYVSDAVACILELWSWLYRISIFILVCVLFRLICYLQILRLQDFHLVFRHEYDVAAILSAHRRIRRQLRVISHRFRVFILSCLIIITLSQLFSLLCTTRPNAEVNLYNAGELALCSIGLVTGMLICLRSATKMTHKAQAITSLAAKWHAVATIQSFDKGLEDYESECDETGEGFDKTGGGIGESGEDIDEIGEGTGKIGAGTDLDDIMALHPTATTISFQKRQALVTYLENNKAGITVFGFMLDRSWLHMIFGVELSLVLWLLGKTVGFS